MNCFFLLIGWKKLSVNSGMQPEEEPIQLDMSLNVVMFWKVLWVLGFA